MGTVQDNEVRGTARLGRSEHGIMWGFVIAAVVFLATGAVIGKSVSDNSRSPASSGVQSLDR